MFQPTAQATPTERVVARLRREGWIDCPGLGFPALSNDALGDLKSFVLRQLQKAGGQMSIQDLKLAALIFVVPAHQFEVHPHLRFALKRLQADGVVEVQQPIREKGRFNTQHAIVRLGKMRSSVELATAASGYSYT